MANKVPALKDKTVAILLGKIERLYRQAKEDSGTPAPQTHDSVDEAADKSDNLSAAFLYSAQQKQALTEAAPALYSDILDHIWTEQKQGNAVSRLTLYDALVYAVRNRADKELESFDVEGSLAHLEDVPSIRDMLSSVPKDVFRATEQGRLTQFFNKRAGQGELSNPLIQEMGEIYKNMHQIFQETWLDADRAAQDKKVTSVGANMIAGPKALIRENMDRLMGLCPAV